MDKITIVPIDIALKAKRQSQKSEAVKAIEGILAHLTKTNAAMINAVSEKPATVKNRVYRVIKALNLEGEVQVKQSGNTIYFFKR